MTAAAHEIGPISTANAAEVVYLFDAEKSKPRKRPFSVVRVHNRNCMGLPLPDGNSIGPGIADIKVYDDSVAAVISMVESDAEGIRVAGEMFEQKIAELVRERLEKSWPNVDREELVGIIRDKGEPYRRVLSQDAATGRIMTVESEHKNVLGETDLSIEAMFREARGRDMKPLVSAHVIEEGLPEPQREGQAAEQAKLVEALRTVMGGHDAEAMKNVMARLDKLAEDNEALRNELKQLRQQANQNRR